MGFFDDCKTIAQAKQRRAELAKRFHPDVGGDKNIMAQINREYDEFRPARQDWGEENPFNRFNTFDWSFMNDWTNEIEQDHEIANLKTQVRYYLNRTIEDKKTIDLLTSKATKYQKEINDNRLLIMALEKRLKDMAQQLEHATNELASIDDAYEISLIEYLKRRYNVVMRLCQKVGL